MVKFLYFITIVCLLAGTSLAHRGSGQPWYSGFYQFFVTPSTVCTNSTTQLAYLTRTLALIKTFQSNATTNATLQTQLANLVAFVQSPANQASLYSNCTTFVSGVKKAKEADRIAQKRSQMLLMSMEQQFRQVPRDVAGTNGTNDMD